MICLDGIMIDPERIEAIKKIVLPHNKRSMQSIFKKINFMRWFISDFAKISRLFQEMVKKDVDFKWTKERRDALMKIKEAIVEAPTLRSLDFEKDFILYTFSYDHSVATMLTQKNEVGE